MDVNKIMLVDDDDDLRALCEVTLRRASDWQLVLASSGPEAVRKAGQERPDIILLDMMMPGMDGISTLEVLRSDEATAQIPVVFLTARVQKREVEQYLRAGAVGVITKPFNPLALADEVRRIAASVSGPMVVRHTSESPGP